MSSVTRFTPSFVMGSCEGVLWFQAWVVVNGCSTGVRVESQRGMGWRPSQWT